MTVTYEEAKRFALSLPGVTEEPHFGVPSFRVNKRILVTVPPGDMLHVFVSDEERDMCLTVYAACTEKVLWGGKVVGIRVFLAKATRGTVEDLILRAWKHRAPGKTVAAWEATATGAGKKAAVAKVPSGKPVKRKAASTLSKAPGTGKAPAVRKAPGAGKEAANVDAYIAGFPAELRARLEQVRAAIRKAAPQATESISYRIPAYKLDGTLIYFAGFAHHIGMYPAPRSSAEFHDELAAYDGGKGTVQFPHARPLPLDLIRRIVKFRAAENRARAAARQQPKARKAAAKPPARKRTRPARK